MPLDYRLISGLPAPQLDTFQQIQGFGQAAEEDRQQQQAKIDARVMQQVLQENIDNPDNAVMALKRKGMFGAATKLETHITEMKQKTAAARKTELEAAKIALENSGKHPDQESKKIETELKLIAARDPKLVLEGIANSQSQQDLDHWLGAAKFLLPKESEAIIATLPTVWTPDVPKWAARQAIGAKEVANNALQERGQDMTAATAAAGQQTTQRGQDIAAATAAAANARMAQQLAETIRHNRTTEGQSAAQLAETIRNNKATSATGPDGKPIQLSVGQKEDIVTIDDLTGLIAESTKLGDTIGWKGVGALWSGSIGQSLGQYGLGSENEEILRNKIGNIQGTIAKLRGGTAFSKQEKEMLDTYTPTINDGDMRIQAKIKSLDQFLKNKRRNILAVAAGNFSGPSPDAPVEIKAVGGKFQVTGRDGVTYSFPSKSLAEQFKRDGG